MNLRLRQCADEYISAIECAARLHAAGERHSIGEALAALANSHDHFLDLVGRRVEDHEPRPHRPAPLDAVERELSALIATDFNGLSAVDRNRLTSMLGSATYLLREHCRRAA